MGNNVHFFRQSGGLSLVAQYDFNNNLIDSIGGNNGTGTNITYNSGSFGNEAVFNGSTSEVRVSNSTVWDFTNGANDIPIRIEVLLKFQNSNTQFVIGKSPNAQNGWEMNRFSNKIYMSIKDNITTNQIQVSCDINVDSNGYSLILFEYDGSANVNGMNISVNGLSSGFATSAGTYNGTKLLNTDTTFGRVDRRSNQFLNGAISQIKVYK